MFRTIDNQEAYVIIKAKPAKLIDSLVEDSSNVDPYYVEDFLLMFRTFIHDPVTVFEKLMFWFGSDAPLRDKVSLYILLQCLRRREDSKIVLWLRFQGRSCGVGGGGAIGISVQNFLGEK